MSEVTLFPVRQLQILFTKKCNLNCTYCFEKSKSNDSMTLEQFESIINGRISTPSFYPFGGEPFMDFGIIVDLIEKIGELNIDKALSKNLINSLKFQITNGTLALKYLDFLKKHDFTLQISLDGPKDINDKNRVYKNGRGSFDDVMSAAETLIKEGVKVTFHGAIDKTNFKNLFRIFHFWFEVYNKNEGLDAAIRHIGNNIFQVVFEDNLTDEDVDIFLSQFFEVEEWIMKTTEYPFTDQQRKKLFTAWCTRRGSSCIAGNKMLSMDFESNLFPCHRTAFLEDSENYTLGSIKDRQFKNYQFYNTYAKINEDQCMYSTYLNNIGWQGLLPWLNWCPSTNAEKGLSVFHQSSKHNALMAEIGEFVVESSTFFGIDLANSNDQGNSNCMQTNQNNNNNNNAPNSQGTGSNQNNNVVFTKMPSIDGCNANGLA